MLVTTHYLDEAERCDRIAIMHRGRLAALGTPASLKAAFADRPIVEVRSTDPVAVMAWLDRHPAVEKTSVFGTAAHAVLRGHEMSPDAIRQSLEAAGFSVTSVSRVVPSLEDVFLDVVDRMDVAGAA